LVVHVAQLFVVTVKDIALGQTGDEEVLDQGVGVILHAGGVLHIIY
jgi:hypothetical protein